MRQLEQEYSGHAEGESDLERMCQPRRELQKSSRVTTNGNIGGFVSKALKSHINAFLASDDDNLCAFAAIGNYPHVSYGIFRQTER